jgi:T-complex protein 1 subunit beta
MSFCTITMEGAFMNLEPKVMNKVLQSVGPDSKYDILIIKNGATIIKSVHIDNTFAKVFIVISKGEDDEAGDDATSINVLCNKFLRDAETLIQHQTVAVGWRLVQAQRNVCNQSVTSIDDNRSCRRQLMRIVQTALSSKLLTRKRVLFAISTVDAVIRLKGSGDIKNSKRKGKSTLKASYPKDGLEEQLGVGQTRGLPKREFLLASESMNTDTIKIYGSRIKVGSMNDVADKGFLDKEKMRLKYERIIKLGVMASKHVYFDGVEQFDGAKGGEIVGTFDQPEFVILCEYELIEEIMIGEDKVILLGGRKAGDANIFILHGSSPQFLDQAERFLHNNLTMLAKMRFNNYTCRMDNELKSLRSAILENENKITRSMPLTMPEEREKIINSIRMAASPEHVTEAKDEYFIRKMNRKPSPTNQPHQFI